MTRTLTPLADAYDEWVIEQRAKDDDLQSVLGYDGNFRLSSIGLCPRKQIWQRAGIEGRPISQDTRRMFHERSILHDHHIAVWRRRGLAIAREQRMDAALPDGYKGRLDAVCHIGCDCDSMSTVGYLQISWAQMVNAYTAGDTATWKTIAHRINEHRLAVVEVKTTHPNIINYSARLPRPHNALQAQAYAWALERLYGISTEPYLYYIPVGGSGRPLEYALGRDDTLVEQTVNSLLQTWMLYLEDPDSIPDRKPLMLKDRKERENRILVMEQDWECSDLYCPYSGWPDQRPTCTPITTQNKTGDRIGYLDLTEGRPLVTIIRKWVNKLGLEPEHVSGMCASLNGGCDVIVEDQPRPSSKDATDADAR